MAADGSDRLIRIIDTDVNDGRFSKVRLTTNTRRATRELRNFSVAMAVQTLESLKSRPSERIDPVTGIRRGEAGDFPWRTRILTFDNAGDGLYRAFHCSFTIPNY